MSGTVLITGANRGLGLEFARQYKADGWNVIATCRNPDRAEALNALDVRVMELDVSQPETFASFGASLSETPLDLFINNAGVYGERGAAQAFGSVDVQSWQDTFLVNTIAPLKLTEALIRSLKAGTSVKAVYVSSRMGSIADNTGGGEYIYRTSKTALNMVVSCLKTDLASAGIAVAAMHPGWVRTDMGGPDGSVDAAESVSGLRKVISELSFADSGAFIAYDGQRLPW